MVQDVIRILPRKGDLEHTPEYWQSSGYDDRDREIVEFIVANTGFRPSPNMIYIREGVFHVKDTTTMEQLRELSVMIRERLRIDCFQISIDRERSEAHMLFDWYDREKVKCCHLTDQHQLKLSTMIVRELEIDDIEVRDLFLRYFLEEDYSCSPAVFKKAIEYLRHQRPPKLIYRVMLNSLMYAEKKIQGVVK